MKVLIINTLYFPARIGGAEVSVQLLAEGFYKLGHEVVVLCLHQENKRKEAVINGVKVIYLPLINIYWPFSGHNNILKKFLWHYKDAYNKDMKELVSDEITAYKPDIVHTNNLTGFSTSVWDSAKSQNIPIVHTSRDYYLIHPNSSLYKAEKNISINSLEVKFWKWLRARNSNKVDFYIGISEFIRDLHVASKIFSKENSSIIYNSITKIDKNNKSENGEKVYGFLGRMTKEKGFDIFCQIANKNKGRYKFIAAGRFENNNEGDSLKKLALESKIDLKGFISVGEFINSVDGVILPIKWNEPFGRVVVECALSGLEVYVNKAGGVTELFKYFNNIKNISEFGKNEQKNHDHSSKNEFIFSEKFVCSEYIKVFKSILNDC